MVKYPILCESVIRECPSSHTLGLTQDDDYRGGSGREIPSMMMIVGVTSSMKMIMG